jgi:hypothetical protein
MGTMITARQNFIRAANFCCRKIFLDKQKQPPYTPIDEKQCLINSNPPQFPLANGGLYYPPLGQRGISGDFMNIKLDGLVKSRFCPLLSFRA